MNEEFQELMRIERREREVSRLDSPKQQNGKIAMSAPKGSDGNRQLCRDTPHAASCIAYVLGGVQVKSEQEANHENKNQL